MRQIRWIVVISLAVLFTIVVFRNLESTNLELVVTTVELPLAALLILTLLLGFGLGLMFPTMWKVRSWQNARQKRKTEKTVGLESG